MPFAILCAMPGAAAGAPEGEAEAQGGWHLVPADLGAAKKGSAAILHTADFERSDPRLAGLMLRCAPQGIEAVIVVVEPFPPHAQPKILMRTPEQSSHFTGSVIPTGAGIRLPGEATALVKSGGTKEQDVEIKVSESGAEMSGTIALSGLPKALEWLGRECVQK